MSSSLDLVIAEITAGVHSRSDGLAVVVQSSSYLRLASGRTPQRVPDMCRTYQTSSFIRQRKKVSLGLDLAPLGSAGNTHPHTHQRKSVQLFLENDDFFFSCASRTCRPTNHSGQWPPEHVGQCQGLDRQGYSCHMSRFHWKAGEAKVVVVDLSFSPA